MGQPSGSWCISFSNLLSFPQIRRKKKKSKLFWGVCLYASVDVFVFFTKSCVSVSICTMIFILKPYDMPAIFTLDLSFIAIEPNTESVEDLMQRFQDSFRVPNTPTDMSHYQHVVHSSSTGRRRVPSHTRGRTKSHSKKFTFFVGRMSQTSHKMIHNIGMFSFHFCMCTGQCLQTFGASVALVSWCWGYLPEEALFNRCIHLWPVYNKPGVTCLDVHFLS